MGYPSNEPDDGPPPGEELIDLIEKVEGIESDMRSLRSDRSEFYAVAKARGFDVKTIKRIVALRKRDAEDLAEEEALLESYKSILGM